ncbi:MAG: hypothetical protein WDN23_20785 [Edaphobacter sp.]
MTFLSKFLLATVAGSAVSSFAASIPKAVLPDNVVLCDPGDGCVSKTLYGRSYKVIATPRFTVMVSVSREGNYTRADVSVTNNTDMPLSVSPEDFRVEVVTPKPKVLLYVPPSELNLPVAQPAPPAPANQSAPQTPPAPSDKPAVQQSAPAAVPEEAQKAALEAADKAATEHHLAATSIPPNEMTRGRVYFENDKRAQLVNVVLPIAGVVFEFPYKQKR